MSHLEVLPLHVLVGFTVCDDDGRLVASYGQALIILHQLVGFIDAEQLKTRVRMLVRDWTRKACLILSVTRGRRAHSWGGTRAFIYRSSRLSL